MSSFDYFIDQYFSQPLIASTIKNTQCIRQRLSGDFIDRLGVESAGLSGLALIKKLISILQCSPSNISSNDIPVSGSLIVVANHPFGVFDSLNVLKLILDKRDDVKIFIDAAFKDFDPASEILLPLCDVDKSMNAQSLLEARKHLKRGGVVLIHPAGKSSRLGIKGVRDVAWHNSFAHLAIKQNVPVLPVKVLGGMSFGFYLLELLLPMRVSDLWRMYLISRLLPLTVKISIGKPHVMVDSDNLQCAVGNIKNQLYLLG